MNQAEEPRTIAWCSWHDGLSDTARLIQVGEAGKLFACGRCRLAYGLVPYADQP
ncbi:hypothetical protein [Streptomyces scabiei]|uniref:hypothetical protein n=1 Tax=Streptomyces scabiei TaxID=1930 RepID=UPI001B332D8D|nr:MULTISPECIES: hypothetical protein [Streptomyces]MDX2686868.1 hypothetical protein [Streptomyces scabiei]MDX2753078.1 hypothetical protein [Streptomyces scabiei]MDX2807267.1 hypothetical protein [Streptomyces scabiei]MDX3201012.1 hypothetical protein [Streptomyces scabiei]MDX3219017.1 hypothetical protein [Streptomyces scabiei]